MTKQKEVLLSLVIPQMKFYFLILIFFLNCQVSWYHTRVSKNEAKETQISEAENVFGDPGTACFISSLKFQGLETTGDSALKLNPIIDTQIIENIRTNLKLKNTNTKHIKHIYGVPKSWPYLKELKFFRKNKTFGRFKEIQNLSIEPQYKKTLMKYAEIADVDTYFFTDEDILTSFLEFENCDTYYQLNYTKREKDNYNVVLFLITLGILPTVNYENHFFTVYKRKAFELKRETISYKFGYRRLISWLLLPTFNFFNEVENYNKDYRFVDHAKDQFLSAIENKYSKPLPIKHLNPVYGDIIGGMYSSDSDLFKTQIPVDTRFAVVRDGKQNVSFYDPIHGLYKIQAINTNTKINSDIITEGFEKTLKTFITTNLVDKVKKNYPKSTILHEMYTPDYRDGTYTFILEIAKPEPGIDEFKKEYFVFSCFKSQSQIYILSRSLPNDTSSANLYQLAESNILDFYSQISFQSKYIEPKPIAIDLAMNDEKRKTDTNAEDDNYDDEEDDEEDSEDEEGSVESGGGIQGEMDLSGLVSILKERTKIPKGKLDIKPGRFQINQSKWNPPKMKSSKFHIKPARTKNFSNPRKWRK
ncbi:hypothetical protein [Leptospira bandrabouensis]|uniref:hypothetical protein n=2 Tax=Leptospira bandrabouensis TaxID=2484903 RepID=UPI002AC87F72|nr:hypothetical protein [Leptospira bandrabouensis]